MVMIFAEAERSNQCKSVAETDGACVYIMGWQPCGRALTWHFACCVRAMPRSACSNPVSRIYGPWEVFDLTVETGYRGVGVDCRFM